MIKVKKLNKSFNDIKVLNNINLSIFEGDVVSIIGPSGSGKSTLLRCLIDLEKIDCGQIFVDNNLIFDNSESLDISKKKKALDSMGMVFQSFNLFSNMNVLDNITKPLMIVDNKKRSEATSIAIKFLKLVGLEEKINAFPKELSGGQKQRVAIARALARNPKYLLFDEPTSALDPEMVREVLNTIAFLKKLNITMLIVSHEMEFVRKVSDKVYFIEDGNFIFSGSSDNFFNNSKNKRITSFLSDLN